MKEESPGAVFKAFIAVFAQIALSAVSVSVFYKVLTMAVRTSRYSILKIVIV